MMPRGILLQVPEPGLSTEREQRCQIPFSCKLTKRIKNQYLLMVRCENKCAVGIISSEGRKSALRARQQKFDMGEDEQFGLHLRQAELGEGLGGPASWPGHYCLRGSKRNQSA